MKYCQRCVIPDTRPNITLNEEGVCNACISYNSRKVIDWKAREKAFQDVVTNARSRSKGYDCLIPVSGGKDSTWQVVKCLEYGLKPLCVTWKTPGRTEIGRQNLENLINLGVDHIDYQISPETEKKFMLQAFERYGSTAIPMHMALFNIPLTIAVRFQIPLIIWGENSAFEYGGTEEERTGFRLDERWLKKYGLMHGTTAEDWIGPELSRKDLTAYFGPGQEALERENVLAVFLGYYFPWDPETSFAVAKAHGFKSGSKARTGTYTYADIDDDFISLHHWMKWYKFGFTRSYDNLSLEIRNGRVTRPEAIKTLKELGDETPYQDIAKFCAFAGIQESEFFNIAEKFRNSEVWVSKDQIWQIEDFIIPEWNWQASEKRKEHGLYAR